MISEAEKAVLAKYKLDESQYLIKRVKFAAEQKTTWAQLIQLTQEDREMANKMGLKLGDFIDGKLADLATQVAES